MEIRKLNTLRGLAALIVMFSHYSNGSGLLSPWLGWGAGQLGVMLFFCLSGFLMAYLYLEQPFNRRTLSGYLIARGARVLPLFVLICLLSYGLQKTGATGIFYDIGSLSSLLSHLLLLNGTLVLWTIPTEIHFYLLFVFLWWFWQRRGLELLVLVFFLIALLGYLGFPRLEGQALGLQYSFRLGQALPYFLVGLLFGLLYKRAQWVRPMQRNFYLISLAGIPLLYPNIHGLVTGETLPIWQNFPVLLSVALVFFAIAFLVPDDNPILVNSVGDFLGKISYSLYLLHTPVFWQVQPHAQAHPGLLLPVYIGLTVIASYLSFMVIEHPARLFVRRAFAASPRGSRTPA